MRNRVEQVAATVNSIEQNTKTTFCPPIIALESIVQHAGSLSVPSAKQMPPPRKFKYPNGTATQDLAAAKPTFDAGKKGI